MEPHYHAWLRSGRVFTMSSKRWGDRTAAHRWAAARRPAKADRLVLSCTDCPTSRPSRRRPRWPAIAKSMAEALGVPLPAVRDALLAARDTPT